MLSALDAMRAARLRPSVNLKFFFEGEEEAGSPHLRQMLERHRDALKGDAWLFCDGPNHQSGKQQVQLGVRGITGLDVTVYGPTRPLHSGHYGNWAPNPGAMIASLIASMRTSWTNPDCTVLRWVREGLLRAMRRQSPQSACRRRSCVLRGCSE